MDKVIPVNKVVIPVALVDLEYSLRCNFQAKAEAFSGANRQVVGDVAWEVVRGGQCLGKVVALQDHPPQHADWQDLLDLAVV